jgi:hypothetical protein
MAYRITTLLLLCSAVALPQTAPDRGIDLIVGNAFTSAAGPRILQRLCDETGGRLMGTAGNERGLEILAGELAAMGFAPRREPFSAPGWERGEDVLSLTSPVRRILRSAALGYTEAVPAFEDTLVFVGGGHAEEYTGRRASGKIVLVSGEPPRAKEPLLRYEVIDIAAAQGARAVLFINDKEGGLLLCGVGNFQGHANAVPAFSITLEEGRWLQRLIGSGVTVKVRMDVRSRTRKVTSANLVATLPGRSPRKIIVGAHCDSWDLSQGALDNGIGSAIIADVARLLKTFSPVNAYTVEFVWFNGEELGLWGAKAYLATHSPEEVAAVINLDMMGSPRGFNVMGYDEAIPLLQGISRRLPGFHLEEEIQSVPSTNSDHQPFLLAGIPAIAPYGWLDGTKVRYYHDLADTYDKAEGKGLCEAAAVVSVMVKELANSPLSFRRSTPEEMVPLLRKHGVEDRLRRQKEWPF